MRAMAVISIGVLLAGCSPFIESTQTETKIGVTINHQKAANFFFSLFTKSEDVIVFNK